MRNDFFDKLFTEIQNPSCIDIDTPFQELISKQLKSLTTNPVTTVVKTLKQPIKPPNITEMKIYRVMVNGKSITVLNSSGISEIEMMHMLTSKFGDKLQITRDNGEKLP